MIIMGIDPGYAIVGVGMIEYVGSKFRVLESAAVITAPKTAFPLRLLEIEQDLSCLLDKHKPNCVAVEKLFFGQNTTTAIDVAQARGVILLAAAKRGLEVFEYTPLQVKSAVVGYGTADKNQVMQMTKRILNLPALPKPDDVADALAIAICHAHSAGSMLKKRRPQ